MNVPALQRAACDDLFGVDRVDAALSRVAITPRLNPEELAQLANASATGALRVWWQSQPQVTQDGVILSLCNAWGDGEPTDTVKVTQTFPAGVIERVDALAGRLGQSRAAIIRRAVASGLYHMGG